MSLIDTLKALAITVRNEKKKEANSAVRIGDLFIAIIDFIKSIQSGEIRQEGVDTYNDTSEGKTSLLNKYPRPELNWTVLVRKDETNEGKASLYKWNGSKWINLETTIYQEDVQEIINLFKVIQNDEFIYAIIDTNSSLLWGIRWDLSIYEVSIPSKTADELKKKLNTTDVLQFLEDSEKPISSKAVKAVIDIISNKIAHLDIEENSDFIKADVDSKGRILGGFRHDGSQYIPKGMPEEAKANFKKTFELIDKLTENNEAFNYLLELFSMRDIEDKAVCITDIKNRLLAYVKADGTFYFEKLQLPKNILDQITLGASPTNRTTNKVLQIPFPKGLCKVNIIGDVLKINSKTQEIEVELEFDDYQGNYFKKRAIISWQGSSSLDYAKKNFSIDLLNDDGSSFKVKFGDWGTFDSFHFKANYIDALHSRNICSMRVLEQVYQTHPFYSRYPFSVGYNYGWQGCNTNDGVGNIHSNRTWNGARCHIDGFPFELFINGEYHGLYTWNIKKHRDNFGLDKSNANHILLELGSDADHVMIQGAVQWKDIEIRNPKKLICFTGEEYDYENATQDENGRYIYRELTDDPNIDAFSASVRQKIERLWAWGGTVASDNFKDTYKQYLNIPFWYDWMLQKAVFNAADTDTKNTLLMTTDGNIWSPTCYDYDTIIGLHWQGASISHAPTYPLTTLERHNIEKMINEVLWSEKVARYNELRQKVYTTEYIVNVFDSFHNIIGVDAYKRDQSKWVEIPSARPNGNYSLIPKTGGFYASIGQIETWMEERFEFLDNIYV